MYQPTSRIRAFTDLVAWQEGHRLALTIYEASRSFPEDEKFGLTNQLRRAAVSITSNIAEGFSRQSSKEQIQFFFIALGSVKEVQSQLLLARDLNYVSDRKFEEVELVCSSVSRLVCGLIRTNKDRNSK